MTAFIRFWVTNRPAIFLLYKLKLFYLDHSVANHILLLAIINKAIKKYVFFNDDNYFKSKNIRLAMMLKIANKPFIYTVCR